MITSTHNPKLQQVRALLTQKKIRDEKHLFVAEGFRLIEEGIHAHWKVNALFFASDLNPRGKQLVNEIDPSLTFTDEVDPAIFNSISATEHSQGIMAIFEQHFYEVPEKMDFVLITDQIRDPGNLGTLMRTAWAANVQLLILTPGCVDPFSPKVVRSAMGAHFHIPLIEMQIESIQAFQKKQNPRLEFLAAVMNQGKSCWKTDLIKPFALILGSESVGISPQLMDLADSLIHLPMPGASESLNAAIAGSILMFEAIRQRSK